MEMQIGDHIKVLRFLYWHHGIYVGNGAVIHFSGFGDGKSRATVQLGTLDEFERGGRAVVVEYGPAVDPTEVIRRAYMLLDTGGYNLLSFNRETVARWC